jgi:hypothetical protein
LVDRFVPEVRIRHHFYDGIGTKFRMRLTKREGRSILEAMVTVCSMESTARGEGEWLRAPVVDEVSDYDGDHRRLREVTVEYFASGVSKRRKRQDAEVIIGPEFRLLAGE